AASRIVARFTFVTSRSKPAIVMIGASTSDRAAVSVPVSLRPAQLDPGERGTKSSQDIVLACVMAVANDPASAAHQVAHRTAAGPEDRRIQQRVDRLLRERGIVDVEHDQVGSD